MDVLATLAATGLACQFTSATIDGRRPFPSDFDLQLAAATAPGFAILTASGERDRPFRIERNGVWTSFLSDEVFEFGRTAVIDIAGDGRATFVTRQPGMAAEMISREGHCGPAGQG